MNFHTQQMDDGVLAVTFDAEGKSVNTFGEATIKELDALTAELSARTDLKGLVFQSKKSTFIAGADIPQFVKLFDQPLTAVEEVVRAGQRIFNRIENMSCPTAALINGAAMGGGLELALACDYRVASDVPGYQIGLPEVKLGLIPAWGGTARLPRIIGADNAIEMICSGKTISAKDALKNKLVDVVVSPDKMLGAALNLFKLNTYQKVRAAKTGPIKLSWTEWMLTFRLAEGQVSAKAGKHYPAPIKALNVMKDGKKLDSVDAMELEVGAFVELFGGDTAKNLIRTFLLEQSVKGSAKKFVEKNGNPTVKSVGVLGAGVMGRGIAGLVAGKKLPVKVFDENAAALEKCYNEAKEYQMSKVGKGYITTEEAMDVMANLRPVNNISELTDADLVIEAIYEDFNAKIETYKKLGGLEGMLASNTSSLSITKMAEKLPSEVAEVEVAGVKCGEISLGFVAEDFCGIHFFNPVSKMPLVEVVRGEKTSDETIATALSFVLAIGKTPVVCKDCNGFVVNRLLFAYLAEFDKMVKEGVNFQQIDKAMENWGLPMGPAALSDLCGIDIIYHAAKVMASAYPSRIQFNDDGPTATLFNAKSYGQKTGLGWYNWTLKGDSYKKGTANHKTCYWATMQMSDEMIVSKLMSPMVAEAKEILKEGVVASWDEINAAMIYGAGFPPFKGGLDRI